MKAKFNNSHNTYQRRGYKVDHWIQRRNIGHQHTFLIHDQGGKFVPTIGRLIKIFIYPTTPCWLKCIVTNISAQVRDPHHVEYIVDVKCVRVKER